MPVLEDHETLRVIAPVEDLDDEVMCFLTPRPGHPALKATHEQIHPGCRVFVCRPCYVNGMQMIGDAALNPKVVLSCRACRSTIDPDTIRFVPIR